MFSCSAICIREVSLGAHMLWRLRVSKRQMLQQAPRWHLLMIGPSVINRLKITVVRRHHYQSSDCEQGKKCFTPAPQADMYRSLCQ